MKIEKAIETLIMENELMQFDPRDGEIIPIETQNQDNQDLYEANILAIKALEKQVLKKPFNEIDFGTTCPVCRIVLISEQHCPRCGQKIDWGEE